MEFKHQIVEKLKEEIVDILEEMETSSGESTCESMTKIADNLEDIVKLVKNDKVLYKTPVVINSLKDIRDFSEKLAIIIRGRSWHDICKEFSPSNTLENIKILKSTLTKANKKDKKNPEAKTPSTQKPGDFELVDMDKWVAYKNRKEVHAKIQLSATEKSRKDAKNIKKELNEIERQAREERINKLYGF